MNNSKSIKRGIFVVLEGTDRSGKTLQSKNICNKLESQGEKCIHIRFPDRKTEIGKLLDLYLRKSLKLSPEASHLLFSANRWEMNNFIKNNLLNGTNVICDRYSFSGIAYSSGAINVNYEWCKSTEKGLVSPDVVIFLDVNLKISSERSGFGEEIYENSEDQQKVYNVYKSFSKYSFWRNVNASQDPESVFNEIFPHIEQVRNSDKSIKYLWEET